jgi:putative colanic acid biosynthesis acetyltransferase WcaF
MGKPDASTDAPQAPVVQDLSRFTLPAGFRGRNALVVQLWWLTQALLFRGSPQFAYGFRRFLLRLFGAKVGVAVILRPSVTVTYPWKIAIGDYAWVGDDVVLYSLGAISIGSHSVVSQRSYLCAADHDYRSPTFEIRARAIVVGSHVWVASDVFVAPGVTIGDSAVVGARSSVFSDLPANMVCLGSPAKPVKPRVGR